MLNKKACDILRMNKNWSVINDKDIVVCSNSNV